MGILKKLLAVKELVLGLLLGALFLLYGKGKEKSGQLKEQNKSFQEKAQKLDEAKRAAYKEKRDVDGVSDSDLLDKLRRRSDDWGGL